MKIFLWAGVVLFLCTIMGLRGFAGMFSSFDNPARLGATVHFTQTNGFTIRWAEKTAFTNGQVNLVFVHGSPGGAGVWASQFASPSPGANRFAYDRPGFGSSKPARLQPHLQEQVDALMCLLACATSNRVLLVGHSYGSPIAFLATLEHPDKINGVLLIGGDVDPGQENPWLVQYAFGWRLTSWLLPRALRQCNREMLTVGADLAEMQKLLPRLSVPVVMLHGARDPLVPVENVRWLEHQLEGLGKSNLFAKIILPDANHFIPWEHPDQVENSIRLLENMVASHRPPN